MRPIRASELGEFLYCRRAWWYRRQGYPSANLPQMRAGAEAHRRHGRQMWRARLAGLVGCVLVALALLLWAVTWAWQISGE